MNILNFDLFLESKNYQKLYHILDFEKLKFVFNTDNLVPYTAGRGHISFTRSKTMNGYLGDSPISLFKLEIDAQKLSNNYKISPFTYVSMTGVRFDEKEERVKGIIKNISKYVTKLIIIKSRIEKFKKSFRHNEDDDSPSDWFTDVKKEELKNIPSMIRYIIENSPYEIYVQEGSVIKKDDEYLNSLANYELKNVTFKYDIWYRGYFKSKRTKYGIIDTFIDSNGDKIENLAIGTQYPKSIEDEYDLLDSVPDLDKIYETKIIDNVKCVPYLIKFRKMKNSYYLEYIKKLNHH